MLSEQTQFNEAQKPGDIAVSISPLPTKKSLFIGLNGRGSLKLTGLIGLNIPNTITRTNRQSTILDLTIQFIVKTETRIISPKLLEYEDEDIIYLTSTRLSPTVELSYSSLRNINEREPQPPSESKHVFEFELNQNIAPSCFITSDSTVPANFKYSGKTHCFLLVKFTERRISNGLLTIHNRECTFLMAPMTIWDTPTLMDLRHPSPHRWWSVDNIPGTFSDILDYQLEINNRTVGPGDTLTFSFEASSKFKGIVVCKIFFSLLERRIVVANLKDKRVQVEDEKKILDWGICELRDFSVKEFHHMRVPSLPYVNPTGIWGHQEIIQISHFAVASILFVRAKSVDSLRQELAKYDSYSLEGKIVQSGLTLIEARLPEVSMRVATVNAMNAEMVLGPITPIPSASSRPPVLRVSDPSISKSEEMSAPSMNRKGSNPPPPKINIDYGETTLKQMKLAIQRHKGTAKAYESDNESYLYTPAAMNPNSNHSGIPRPEVQPDGQFPVSRSARNSQVYPKNEEPTHFISFPPPPTSSPYSSTLISSNNKGSSSGENELTNINRYYQGKDYGNRNSSVIDAYSPSTSHSVLQPTTVSSRISDRRPSIQDSAIGLGSNHTAQSDGLFSLANSKQSGGGGSNAYGNYRGRAIERDGKMKTDVVDNRDESGQTSKAGVQMKRSRSLKEYISAAMFNLDRTSQEAPSSEKQSRPRSRSLRRLIEDTQQKISKSIKKSQEKEKSDPQSPSTPQYPNATKENDNHDIRKLRRMPSFKDSARIPPNRQKTPPPLRSPHDDQENYNDTQANANAHSLPDHMIPARRDSTKRNFEKQLPQLPTD